MCVGAMGWAGWCSFGVGAFFEVVFVTSISIQLPPQFPSSFKP